MGLEEARVDKGEGKDDTGGKSGGKGEGDMETGPEVG